MINKFLSVIAVPVALALCSATAMAQDPASPAPSPSEAPAEKMQVPTPPPAAVTPAPSSETSESSAVPDSTAGTFSAAQAADEWRATKLVGLNVYNQANERVGDINELILGPDGKVSSAVIGLGGFLGMGEKLVAVAFSDLQLNRDANGSHRVMINSSKAALESAPDFKYYSAPATM